jgi:hypothetical protein
MNYKSTLTGAKRLADKALNKIIDGKPKQAPADRLFKSICRENELKKEIADLKLALALAETACLKEQEMKEDWAQLATEQYETLAEIDKEDKVRPIAHPLTGELV